MNWINCDHSFPVNTNKFSYRSDVSDVVLVWIGENNYSYREWTIGYYDHKNKIWEILEPKLEEYNVIAWAYPDSYNSI